MVTQRSKNGERATDQRISQNKGRFEPQKEGSTTNTEGGANPDIPKLR